MLTISISTSQAHNSAPVRLKCSTPAPGITSRISRSATIDGGAVITHLGTNRIDQAMTLRCRTTQAMSAAITAMMEDTTEQTICIGDTLYAGVIERFKPHAGVIRFQISEAVSYGG